MNFIICKSYLNKIDKNITEISTCKKKINLDTDLMTFKKINTRWIMVLNVKLKTIKLKNNIGKKLEAGDGILDMTKRHDL